MNVVKPVVYSPNVFSASPPDRAASKKLWLTPSRFIKNYGHGAGQKSRRSGIIESIL
jgi:hypothetical protein